MLEGAWPQILILVLVPVYLVTNTFYYRFQRVTRGVARDLKSSGPPLLDILGRTQDIQALLTPSWVAIVGGMNTTLLVLLLFLLGYYVGWLWAVIPLAYALAIGVAVDFIAPFPTYRQCFRLIRQEVESKPNGKDRVHEHLLAMISSLETTRRYW